MDEKLNNLFEIPKLEQESIEKIEAYQLAEINHLLAYLKENSRFYQKHFAANGLDFSSLASLNDLQKIPPTNKEDIQQNNDDFICVGPEKIIDYVTSSGTTGEPIVYVLSEEDLERLAYNEAVSLAAAAGEPSDLYQLTTTIDRRFMAGLAYFLGARKLSCGVVRVGSGMPQLQIDTLISIKANCLIAVPSFVISLIEYAKEIGFDLNSTKIKKIICIGESIRDADFKPNALQQKILENWKVKLYSTYASTEMATAYTECSAQRGGHEHPELIYSELLDEHNEVISNPEEYGELCISTLGVKGMPLLRFKTGDIVRFFYETCSCGRTTKRISPIKGRKQQMIKYKGTSLYPQAIYEVLNHVSEVKNYCIEVQYSKIKTDEILIYISSLNNNNDVLIKKVQDLLRAKLRVIPKVLLRSFEEIEKLKTEKSLRKPQLFIDKRDLPSA